jgi:long-chain fatty acid transport protein
MQMHSRNTALASALAVAMASPLAAGPAHAAGFQVKENSVKAMGRAFAGSAAAAGDAAVVVNNPAAMAGFDRRTVQADLTAVDVSFRFSGSGTTALGTPLSGGAGGDAGEVAPIPAFAAIYPLADSGVTLGAMVSAPFGLKTEYERDWVGRYHAVESDLKLVDLTLSASLDLSERISIGAGLIIERAEATLSNAVDFGSSLAAAGATGFAPQSADGFASVTGDDIGFGWLAGVHWRPTDRLAIGYSHRSEVDQTLRGDVDYTVPGSAAAVLTATGRIAAFTDQPVSAPLTTPSVDILSASYAVGERLTLMADVARTDWESVRDVTIYRANREVVSTEPFDWAPTMFYSLGGEYRLGDAVVLRAGVARDQTPTNDEARTPRLPDQDRRWLSLGLSWSLGDRLELSGGYTRLRVDRPTINNLRSGSGSRISGSYSAAVNLLGVAAQYRF